MIPRVVDISHHNAVTNLKATAVAGVWGIIHKATQGAAYRDPMYAVRRQPAKDAGLLWGAYSFNTGDPVAQQVDFFLKCAAPDENTLMVLDYEDNRLSNMSIGAAVEFLRLLEQKLGRKGAIYSGNRLRENIAKLPPIDRDYVLSHRLWLCQYGPKTVLPTGFKTWWLWQYTDGEVNMKGVSPVPGISGLVDRNAYLNSRTQLSKEWA